MSKQGQTTLVESLKAYRSLHRRCGRLRNPSRPDDSKGLRRVLHHRPPADTPYESPTLLAFGWGVIATWWMGLILSFSAVLASRLGSWPKLDAVNLIRPAICLLIVIACTSLLTGTVGYFVAKAGGVQLIGALAFRVPPEKHVAFLGDLWAHLAAYGVGFFGGLVLSTWVVARRWKMARQSSPAQ